MFKHGMESPRIRQPFSMISQTIPGRIAQNTREL
jgi:hypothetical protein